MKPLSLFMLQALVVIALSRVLGLAARRLSQPMVIAEVVAGIVLGPSLLGLVWPEGLAWLFPPASMPALELLSQIGLILFMVLVGLEFDPALLRGRGRASVVISHTSIVVPFVLGAGLAVYLHPRTAPPQVSFVESALFIGVAMSVTAFPVLARILVERQLLRSRIGSVTIACAAVDDVTAWCLLAFVVSSVRATGWTHAVVTTGLTIAYVALMLTVVRPLLRRLGKLGLGREGLSQNIVALLLVLVLVSAQATELIGIHALFGAFVLGATIPKQDGLAQSLATKMEDLVVVFLLPLFFAFSGLRTEIGLLETREDWLMCGYIIVVACIGKFGGSFVAARMTGLGTRESAALGILMNTRGLMELVVLNVGLDLGVISPKLFTMLVLMALFTTFITTPILQLVYPMREMARTMIDHQVPPLPVQRIVQRTMICVADANNGPSVMKLVAAFAANDDEIFALHLKHAAERTSAYAGPQASEPDVLLPTVRCGAELGLAIKPLSFSSTNPGRDICNVAEVKDIDLVLLGWHRPLLTRSVLAGVVSDVLDEAQSHVGVFIDRGLRAVKRILVPYCGTPHDRLALAVAARFAAKSSAAVTILHVISDEPSRFGAGRVTHEVFGDALGFELKLIPHARPAEAAIEEARRGYDLVVIGVGRQWGLPIRHIGLLPEEFVAQSTTSLVIVSKGRNKPIPLTPGASAPLERTPSPAADQRDVR